MKQLWEPHSIALVGATPREGSLGRRLVQHLLNHGYAGDVFPVNPRYEEVAGLRCYPSVAAIPGPVDLALVLVGASQVLGVLQDAAEKGVPYAVLFSSGFGETGAAGKALEREVVAFARSRGIRLIGPNCIGLVSPPTHLVAGFSPLFARARFQPGNLGLITQSGALGYGIVSLALEQGLHFSRVANTGNEADLSTPDLVEGLLKDDVTSAVLVYSEGLKEAVRWRELAALSQERGKPVIILKAGRSEVGSRAAASHTAALAGDDAVWDAAFRQLGLIRVDDVDEMLDLAAAFAQPRRPHGPRVGVLTTSGGAGIMAADGLAREGLLVPELTGDVRAELESIIPSFGSAANPVDVTAQVISDSQLFRRALRAMASDPGLDLLLVSFCVLQGEEADRVVGDLLAVHEACSKPILVSRTGGESLAPGAAQRLQQAGIPVFRSPGRAARAAGALGRFSAQPPAAAASPLPAPGEKPEPFPQPGQALTEREAKALLAAHGLPVTAERLAANADEAAAAARAMGFPVVLKIDSPDIAHKTEAGGVRLGLRDEAEVRAAFDQIMASARRHNPEARLNGCLVQEQVEGALAELLVGVTPSPMGPLITVGVGGIFAELFRDTSQRLAPVGRDEAQAMLAELRGYGLLTGARGRPRADVAALVDLIVRLGEVSLQWPGEWELDMNPVLALPEGQGARIVDALLYNRAKQEAVGC